MKACAAFVVCLTAHASVADASCKDDVTSLEDFMRHTDHVADPLDVPEDTHLVARDDLATSWHAKRVANDSAKHRAARQFTLHAVDQEAA